MNSPQAAARRLAAGRRAHSRSYALRACAARPSLGLLSPR